MVPLQMVQSSKPVDWCCCDSSSFSKRQCWHQRWRKGIAITFWNPAFSPGDGDTEAAMPVTRHRHS